MMTLNCTKIQLRYKIFKSLKLKYMVVLKHVMSVYVVVAQW